MASAFQLMDEERVLTIQGRFAEIKNACQFVSDGAARAGCDAQTLFHLELACDEACTNIIEHAYGGEDVGVIEVGWRIEGDLFVITLRDKGHAFDPESVGAASGSIPPVTNNAEDIRVGGLGMHFMRTLMDEVRFEFDQKNGNTLVMAKRITSEPEA